MATINQLIQENPRLVPQIPRVRAILTESRLRRLTEADFRCLHEHDEGVIANAIEHNLMGIKVLTALARPDLLVGPLRCCDYIAANAAELKVLTVGPRTEAELFSLIAAGFSPANIRGLDLISSSPFMDLGDMRSTPYEDDFSTL